MKNKNITIILIACISLAQAEDKTQKKSPGEENVRDAIASTTDDSTNTSFPYGVGDVIAYTTVNSGLATQKAAKIVSVKGKWIKVNGRAGNRSFSCWINTDNLVEAWKE